MKQLPITFRTGDYITNISDIHPTFIGLVMSVSKSARGRWSKELCVKLVKRPTKPSQVQMPDEFIYPYEMARWGYRKLTEAEILLYVKED